MQNKEELLHVSGIEKSFGSNTVMRDVGLHICKGEIMALLGENGAGKSTLVKILTGVYQRDAGKIVFDNVEFPINFNKEFAEKNGISIIYQELSDIPTLTVAQNIYLGHEPLNKLGLINYKKMNEQAKAVIEKYGFDLNPTDRMSDLSVAKKQLVEILKALNQHCKMLIMDEPTASLSENEVLRLFKIINELKDRGIAILYISHRLKEIEKIADSVTILRDGVVVLEDSIGNVSPDQMIDYMIGKKLAMKNQIKQLTPKHTETVLELKHLTSAGKFEDISFQLKRGEVLGIGGLIGAGRTEVVRAIFGADPFDSGEILLEGKPYTPSLRNALKCGIGFIPEDRRQQGIIPENDISRNIGITNFDQTRGAFGVSRSKEVKLAERMIKTMDVHPADHHYLLCNMSGGNQQKVVIGKWLAKDIKILIADEPTAGVDIGAKSEIYMTIERLCEQGVSVIIVSSDLQELVRISDRVIVMHKRRIFKEFAEGSIQETDILLAASGYETKEGTADE